eukprot:474634-Rhodomonas_salina.1
MSRSHGRLRMRRAPQPRDDLGSGFRNIAPDPPILWARAAGGMCLISQCNAAPPASERGMRPRDRARACRSTIRALSTKLRVPHSLGDSVAPYARSVPSYAYHTP